MTKKILIIGLLLIMLVSFVSVQGSSETISASDTVKVGMFFGSTSVTYFEMAIFSGIFEIGYAKNDVFTKLFEYNESNDIAITRDTYHHIKIGDSHETYESAMKVKNEFRAQDYLAYLAYTGKWEVWIGNFSTGNGNDGKVDAQNFINNSMTGKFDYSTTILEPSSYGIVILKGKDKLFALKMQGYNLRINTKNGAGSGIAWMSGKRYRGNFEIARLSGSDMNVVNTLSVEDYLYGVIPYEMLPRCPIESLKAQAVAARTYALASQGKSGSFQFELYKDTRSQVYNGYDGEQLNTNSAVNDTKGQKLYYNGELARTYFYSSSGGKTENNIYVWGTTLTDYYPYLVSVDDSYEAGNSTYYTWEFVFDQNKVKQKLAAKDINIGDILNMEVKKWTPAGRPYEILIEGTSGNFTLDRTQCRTYFNLPSQWYTIESSRHVTAVDGFDRTVTVMPERYYVASSTGVSELKDNITALNSSGNLKTLNTTGTPIEYRFVGRGYGHSIGLSQEGAKGMAFAGFTYDQILNHYYPGTVLQ